MMSPGRLDSEVPGQKNSDGTPVVSGSRTKAESSKIFRTCSAVNVCGPGDSECSLVNDMVEM